MVFMFSAMTDESEPGGGGQLKTKEDVADLLIQIVLPIVLGLIIVVVVLIIIICLRRKASQGSSQTSSDTPLNTSGLFYLLRPMATITFQCDGNIVVFRIVIPFTKFEVSYCHRLITQSLYGQ